LRGKVALIHFWTYSCINSLRPLPYLKRWATEFGDAGLVVLGVHTPEFSFEHRRENVEWAVREFQVRFPVAVDNNYSIWRAFQNEYWPAFYLADGNGNVRLRRFGEGQYERIEASIRQLLAETGSAGLIRKPAPVVPVSGIEAEPGVDVRTPETYIGYRRAERFAGQPKQLVRDSPRKYVSPLALPPHHWGLTGEWEAGSEYSLVRRSAGKLSLRFHSRDLHLVMSTAANDTPVRFRVTLEGAVPGADCGVDADRNGHGRVVEPRLYQLIRQAGPVRERLFEIEFLDPGVRVFAFTFG
jgi:thiol-disulfide isomerase/thioredoxin